MSERVCASVLRYEDFSLVADGLELADRSDSAVQFARAIAADHDAEMILLDSDGEWLVRPDGTVDPYEGWDDGDEDW